MQKWHSLNSLATFLSLVAIVTAAPQEKPTQTANAMPISKPTTGDVLVAGTTYTIEWKPSIGTEVSIELHDDTFWGYSKGFGDECAGWLINPFCGTIATCVPNTGKYDWKIPHPTSYPRNSPDFWIEMYVCDIYHPELGSTGPIWSASQNFSFAAEPEMSASSSAAAASSSSLAALFSSLDATTSTSSSWTVRLDTTLGSTSTSGSVVTMTVTVHDGSSSTSAMSSTNGVTSSAISRTPSQQPPLTTSSGSLSTVSASSTSSASSSATPKRASLGMNVLPLYLLVISFVVGLMIL